MKKLLLTLLFLPLSSHALLEARLTYGGLVSKDILKDVCTGSCTGTVPGMVPLYGMGADAIVKLPLVPFGIGLRYEKLSLSASTSSVSAKANFERTALLLNYRLIDTILHVGPIVTYGISHKGSLSITDSGTLLKDYSTSTAESYSLGLEVGVKPLIVLPLSVGAEAGLNTVKLKKATNSVDSTSRDLDLSGSYLKLFLGLDF